MPRIEQLLLRLPDGDAESARVPGAPAGGEAGGAYIVSLSFRTVTYKALCAADQLAHFYPDLSDPSLAVPFGIFHQRFSTNTSPSWERAQPFRLLCHNGEINAIQGNVNWMRAREGNFGSDDDELLHPVIDEAGSDSAMLDNALELLVRGGRDVRHALTMLVPEAWEGNDAACPPRCATTTATTRSSWSRGTARPGSSSPTDVLSGPRSTATGCGRSAGRSAQTGSSSAAPKRAPSTCPAGARSGAAGSGRES